MHPKEGERFYLRLLLVHVKGATSFAHLKEFGGVQYPTFKAACCARGLLADDNEWKETLLEAATTMPAKPLRDLFIHILFHNEPTDPIGLWNLVIDDATGRTLKTDMAEDFRRARGQIQQNRAVPVNEDDINQCIYALDDLMREVSNGAKGFIADYDITPTGERRRQEDPLLRAVNDERSYDCREQQEIFERDYSKLNATQKAVFDELYSAVRAKAGGLYFIDAPGGTGKTFLANLLLAAVRKDRNIGVATASSGIAAILLRGGRTAHSRWKNPINALMDTRSSVSKRTAIGKLILQSSSSGMSPSCPGKLL